MATLRELNIKLGADITDLERKMKRASNQLRREGRNWSSLGNELSAAVTVPLLGIGAAAIKSAADFEQMETSFAVLLGSAEKAKDLFGDLKDFAAKTPFQVKDIASSAKQLLAFGFSVNESKDALQFMGDIAGATGSNLSDLTMILGQAKAIGAAYTQDLRQLANRGIPVFDLLKDKFNVTGEELSKMVSDGKISFEVLQEVLKDTTKQGGLFFGGMEKQSKTLAGQFSTFKDNVANSLASLGESITEAFDLKTKMANAATWVGEVAKSFENLDDSTKKNIVTTGLVVASIGPALKAYGMLKNTMAGVIDLGRAMVGNFKSVAGAVLNAAESFRKMSALQKGLVLGAVTVAVAAATAAYQIYTREIDRATAAQRALNEVEADASKMIAAQKVEASALIEVLKKETSTREQKEAAIRRLNEISGEYFSGLSAEKSSVEDLTTAYDGYIKQLMTAARVRAAQDKMVELEKQRIDLVQRLERMQGASGLKKAFLEFEGVAGESMLEYAKKEIEKVEAQQEALAKLAFDSGNQPMATGGSPTSSSLPTASTGGTSKATASTKEQVDVLGELATAYDLIAQKSAIYGSEMDATVARSAALKTAINDLLESGVAASDPQVQALAERYRNLNMEMLPVLESQVSMNEPMALATTVLAEQEGQVRQTSMAWAAFGEMVASAAEQAGGSLTSLAMQGETSYKKLGKAALKSAADVIRSALMSYVAQVIKDTGLVSGPLAPLIAPAAGAAAGLAFNGILKGLKIPAMAEGGLVTKPTLALIGEAGPEMVVPPKKLPGMAAMMGYEKAGGRKGGGYIAETRIKGSDLFILLREAAIADQRRTGNSLILNG